MKYLIILASLGFLAACDPNSMGTMTPEREALIRAFCSEEESVFAAYLESRGTQLTEVGLPNFGPERDLYCAFRLPMLDGE